ISFRSISRSRYGQRAESGLMWSASTSRFGIDLQCVDSALNHPAACVPTTFGYEPLELTISIVSFRTPELLRACLRALSEERTRTALEVTVVDNASADGSVSMIHAEFTWVTVIENDVNRGFGAAHNQALRQ